MRYMTTVCGAGFRSDLLSRASGLLGVTFIAQNAESALGSLVIYAWKELFNGMIETSVTKGVDLALNGLAALTGWPV